MHDLATKVWEPRNANLAEKQLKLSELKNAKKSDKLKCRLEWVVQCCVNYFKCSLNEQGKGEKLGLLDVGSCYNPFLKFSNYFDIVAVDLCPAPGYESQVFRCDFLELNVDELEKRLDNSNSTCSEMSISSNVRAVQTGSYNRIMDLPRSSFEVVVFSFFLEYLADPKQRVESCRKAHLLLKTNGLLFILRPDSCRVTPGRNSILMKKMKIGMALLGFKRLYFEKLEHLWCMAFKRLEENERDVLVQGSYFKKDVDKVEVNYVVEDMSRIHELFYIPQDFKDHLESESSVSNPESVGESRIQNNDTDISWLEELPCFEVSWFHHC